MDEKKKQYPEYNGTFDQQISDLYQKIENRQPFNYDVNADPLYQQYKDNYLQQGKLAMKDTMGKAAALSGGYGNSYAAQVGQQAYDAQLQNLSNVVPELYGLAKDRYDSEGDDLRKNLSLLQDQRDTEYDRYRDDVADWRYSQELDRSTEQRDYERRIAEDNTAYTRQQNAYSNLYNMILGTGYDPSDEELEAAGMNRNQVESLLAYYRYQHPELFATSTSGGGGGSGSRRSSQTPTADGAGTVSGSEGGLSDDYLRNLGASLHFSRDLESEYQKVQASATYQNASDADREKIDNLFYDNMLYQDSVSSASSRAAAKAKKAYQDEYAGYAIDPLSTYFYENPNATPVTTTTSKGKSTKLPKTQKRFTRVK